MKVFVECPVCKHGHGQEPQDRTWMCNNCGMLIPQELREAVLHNWDAGDEQEEDGEDGAGEVSLLR